MKFNTILKQPKSGFLLERGMDSVLPWAKGLGYLVIALQLFSVSVFSQEPHRIIPADGWGALSIGVLSPAQSWSEGIMISSGELNDFSAGASLDSGLLYSSPGIGEGSDLRATVDSLDPGPNGEVANLAGLMIRDSDAADAAFVFLGRTQEGVWLISRRDSGENVVSKLLGPVSFPDPETGEMLDCKRFRLVVGQNTVYAYWAFKDFSSRNGPNVWLPLGGVSIDLNDEPEEDLGGVFLDSGMAFIQSLVKTRSNLWSERTAHFDDLEEPLAAGWSIASTSSISTAVGSFGVSHPAAPGGLPIRVPVEVKFSGYFDVYIHRLDSGAGSLEYAAGSAPTVKRIAQPTFSDLAQPVPGDIGANWSWGGPQNGGELSDRVYFDAADSGTHFIDLYPSDAEALLIDGVRLLSVPDQKSVTVRLNEKKCSWATVLSNIGFGNRKKGF